MVCSTELLPIKVGAASCYVLGKLGPHFVAEVPDRRPCLMRQGRTIRAPFGFGMDTQDWIQHVASGIWQLRFRRGHVRHYSVMGHAATALIIATGGRLGSDPTERSRCHQRDREPSPLQSLTAAAICCNTAPLRSTSPSPVAINV